MELDVSVINLAINKKYTEFSDAIKNALHNKMANHELVKQYSTEFDNIQRMKEVFASVNNVDNGE